MYTNCDTLTNKICELKLAIDSNDPDIIVLSEVTPKNNRYILQKSEIEIKGYNSYISNFEDTNTRGVAWYVKKCITSNQIELDVSYASFKHSSKLFIKNNPIPYRVT